MQIEDTATVPISTLAAMLPVSERQVARLVKAGIFKPTMRGRYDLAGAIASWTDYVSDGREPSEMASERLRLLTAQRKNAEMDADQRAGKLLDGDDVQTVINAMTAVIASGLESLGGRLAGELAGESDAAVIRQRLLAETRRIRTEAADKLAAFADLGRAHPNPAPAAGKKRRR